MGLIGLAGPMGPAGPAGVADTTTLCLTKRASRRMVRQGGLVRWTIVVSNCGNVVASRVSVVDRLSKGATFTTRGGGRLVRGQLVWKAGTLAPGARRVYRVTTRFGPNARPGRYVTRATADAGNSPPTTRRGSTTVRSRV
jgi:uncharacterized repeat protein (TIGR01451 family)